MPVTTPERAVAQALDTIAGAKHHPARLRLACVQCTYVRTPGAPTLVQWMCMAIGREPRMTVWNTREYLVGCQPVPLKAHPTAWEIAQTTTTPPQRVPGLYRQLLPNLPQDDLTLLRTAPSIPPAQLRHLATPARYATLVKPNEVFDLLLTPKALMVLQNRKVLKTIAY